MTPPMFDHPSVAAAAGRCVTARSIADRRGAVTTQHPRHCDWCAWPLEELAKRVRAYFDWAKHHERTNTFDEVSVRQWQALPPDVKEAQIVEAQGLDPERPAEPVPVSREPINAAAIQEPAPVTQPDEEVAWLPSR